MKLPVSIAILSVVLLAWGCGSGASEAQRHNQRGMELAAEDRWQEAIFEYNKAIDLDRDMVPAFLNRGEAYNLLQDHRRALADLNKAIELDPTLDKAYLYRGNAYEGLGEVGRAVSDYEKALALTDDPNSAAAIESRIELVEGLDVQ
jgi:tetratricopeptide (TPR) repeat protein